MANGSLDLRRSVHVGACRSVCLCSVSVEVLTNRVIGINSYNLSPSALNPSKSMLTCCQVHSGVTRNVSRVSASGSQGEMFQHKRFPSLTLFVTMECFKMTSRRLFCCTEIRIKLPNTREKWQQMSGQPLWSAPQRKRCVNYPDLVQVKEAFVSVPAGKVGRNCLFFLFCPYVAALKWEHYVEQDVIRKSAELWLLEACRWKLSCVCLGVHLLWPPVQFLQH